MDCERFDLQCTRVVGALINRIVSRCCSVHSKMVDMNTREAGAIGLEPPTIRSSRHYQRSPREKTECNIFRSCETSCNDDQTMSLLRLLLKTFDTTDTLAIGMLHAMPVYLLLSYILLIFFDSRPTGR